MKPVEDSNHLSDSKDPSTKDSDDNSDYQSKNELKEEITNDGVKILEEVFGKASVGDEKEEAKMAESNE